MTASLDPALTDALTRLAEVPQLLVTSDYDGVLAPIVADPAAAFPLPAAIAALADLADLPGTTVALVSGRKRADLAALAGTPPEVILVGSHGAEYDHGFAVPLDDAQRALHGRLRAALTPLTRNQPGVWLEEKPASLVVHTRNAARPIAAEVTAAVTAGPASWPDVHVTNGKEVVELAVTSVTKGTAIDTLRRQPAADAVLFLGDDVTDENGFARLRPATGDVGVKVGRGETRAGFRVPDPEAAVRVLEFVAAHRLRR